MVRIFVFLSCYIASILPSGGAVEPSFAVQNLGKNPISGFPFLLSPETFHRADGSVPAFVNTKTGETVLPIPKEGSWILPLTLDPGEYTAFTTTPSSHSVSEEKAASSTEVQIPADLKNEFLSLVLETSPEGGPIWRLGLPKDTSADSPWTLLRKMRYRGFLDTEPRGRIKREEYERLGAIDFFTLPPEAIHRMEDETGVSLQIQRTAKWDDGDIKILEILRMPRGMPVLQYRLQLRNESAEDKYLAYVFWEGDVNGIYGDAMKGEKLLYSPYASTPVRLVKSGKAELTRWGRGWGTERSWVGMTPVEGIGVSLGVTTPERLTENHYYGSSIWVGSTYTAHFDLTETTHGYYPVQLPSGGEVREFGLDFLVYQSGVSPQAPTRNWLLESGYANRSLDFLQTINDRAPLSMWTPAESHPRIRTDIPLDSLAFSKLWAPDDSDGVESDKKIFVGSVSGSAVTLPMQGLKKEPVKLTINFRTTGNDTQLIVEALGSNDSRSILGEASAPEGSMTILLQNDNEILQKDWNLVLRSKGTDAIFVESMDTGPTPLPAPQLQSPLDGQTLTDLAAFFRWEAVPGALRYELEFTREGDATPRVETIDFIGALPHFMPQEPLPLGEYTWRVRSITPSGSKGEWSDTLPFTVRERTEKTAPIRPIGVDDPLFTLEIHAPEDLRPFPSAIPDDIRPYSALVFAHTRFFHRHGKTLIEMLEELEASPDGPMNVIVRTHGHGNMNDIYVSLSELEEAFKRFPWFIGVIGGESFEQIDSEKNPYVRRMIELCAQYGRWFIEGDGNYRYDKLHRMVSKPEMMEFLREYGDHIVFSQKNNIHYMAHVTQASILGMDLSGLIAHAGSWEDSGWYWEQVGFRGLGEWEGIRSGDIKQTPTVFWALTWVHGLSQGCTVFHVDGQVATIHKTGANASLGSAPHAVWTRDGQTTDTFKNVIVPILRAIAAERLIPTEEQVIERMQIAVRQDQPWQQEEYDEENFYAHYTDLFAATYGFESPEFGHIEFFPNNSRFAYFPIIPLGGDPILRPDGERVAEVPLSSLHGEATVRRTFEEAIPKPETFGGDALTVRYSDRAFVQNTNENKDVRQNAWFDVGEAGIEGVEATIEPHMYLITRWDREEPGLWLQTNCEYKDRELSIAFHTANRPNLQVEPANALIEDNWDVGNQRFTIRLTSAFGAVNLTLTDNSTD